jgi:hypothetical protein
MLKHRSGSFDGPDNTCREFEHRIESTRSRQQKRMGCGSLFLVSEAQHRSPTMKMLTRPCRTSTSFQLLYGRLSDIFSRKTVLLSCIFIFFIGSLAASLAQTATQLIAFRALTGVGGGGLMTLAQTIVSDVVTLRERYVSFLSSPMASLLTHMHRKGKVSGHIGTIRSSQTFQPVLIGNTGCRRCDFEWYWPNRRREPQLDRFGVMVSRCR